MIPFGDWMTVFALGVLLGAGGGFMFGAWAAFKRETKTQYRRVSPWSDTPPKRWLSDDIRERERESRVVPIDGGSA